MAGDYVANEAFVRDAVARGDIADFTQIPGYNAEQKPNISAAFLRRLMLGLEQDADGKIVKPLLPGVRIKGAFLAGALDLADCAGAGGAGLPALALEACDLPHRIDVSHARLARLSLEGSRFRALWGPGLRVDGDLNFIRALPAPAALGGDETAYIRLRAARIGGDVWGRGAKLCGPDAIPEGMESVPSTFHAQDADIGGSVVLDDGFSARGPVSLFGAEIGGTLQCDGAQFSNSGREALFANNADIGGDVLLRGSGEPRFLADGSVSLSGIKLGGSLDCSGGRFANVDGHALVAENAEIGGAVLLRSYDDQRFEAEGHVSISGSKIGGSLECSGGRFANAGGFALLAANTEIGGAVLLRADAVRRFEADGEISFLNAKIRGSLDCDGGRFTDVDGYALRASGSEVGGDVTLGATASHRFESKGAVSFTGAKIAGKLGSFGGRFANATRYALLADNAEIGGGVVMTLAGEQQRYEAEGTVLLSGTKIGGTLDCSGGRFVNSNGYAILAENVEIGGAMLLRAYGDQPFEAEGAVSFLGAKIARDAELHGAKFKDDGWALGLQNARIEGRCAAWGNDIKGSVGLAGLRVGRLYDDPTTAWGDPKSKFLVDLSEIDLDRIGVPIGAARPLWRARARWLRRNTGEFVGERLSKFSNQPWRQVAAAFERAGLRGDARRIRREEQRELNRHRFLLVRPFVWLFAEQMFGYGLSVTRAAITVFAVWVIGALGVSAMNARGALVAVHGSEATTEACVGLDPALYALDAMAPVIDLNQESACVPGRVAGKTLSPGYQTPVGVVFEELALWQWAKALFSILGAAVVGFALLTWTGVFKPRAD